jgi:tRNA modification GTPase
VLLIHDATQRWGEQERRLAVSLEGRPHVRVENKVDLLGGGGMGEDGCIQTSALTGFGLEALRAALLRELGAGGAAADSGALNTLRQHKAVGEAVAGLDAAATANAGGQPHEIVLLDLHGALRALDSLTGTTTPEDILGRIFATFCIGK